MSWKIALVVALLNAIITAVVTIPVADKVTKAHGVSDFEGGRGMAIAFILIPAGFREEHGHLIVPAIASLNSRSYQRSISFHLGDDLWFSTEIELAATPKEADKAWTPLKAMRVTTLSGFDDSPSGILLRYRVVEAVE